MTNLIPIVEILMKLPNNQLILIKKWIDMILQERKNKEV